ncbi:MAG TPA: CpaF/VirB11 family protein [Candidatus Acidoferrum sp.]|nr:CpaF/VirB11 family protein [Candidatus Acidoferrum sp.]
MQQTERKPLFDLGQLVATPGALAALEKSGQSPMDFLSRHVTGDWGDIPDEDRKENQLSLEKGFRLMSSYRTTANETTLLTALGKFIPADERILLIEDTAEIQLTHENLVRFEARREQNGTPAVSIRDLLKAALRHRPDRILLGEIRSGEAFDLLQLLNTGHSGTISTIHASSAKQGLARFTSCVLQSGVELPYRAIKTNIGDSLNVVIQIERRPGRRFISEVLEINSYDPDADLFDFCAIYVAPRERT